MDEVRLIGDNARYVNRLALQKKEVQLQNRGFNQPCIDQCETNSSSTTLEKDSGISRMTDSDPEILSASALPCDNRLFQVADDPSNDKIAIHNKLSLDRELASLHKEMETIRLECDKLILKHTTNSAQFDRMHENLQTKWSENFLCAATTEARDDTTSAYNTAESSRSTPIKQEIERANPATDWTLDSVSTPNQSRKHFIVAQKPSTSQNLFVNFRLPQYSAIVRNEVNLKQNGDSNSHNVQPQLNGQSRSLNSDKAGITMYSKPQKLAETIALQQRLLREAMIEQAKMLSAASIKTSRCEFHHLPAGATKYHWKIKRRSDGTRYVTRKLTRTQVLRDREQQLNKERTGISTDDDALSELKLGRFWNREDRKKHLVRARERKLKHHQILAQKSQQPSDQLIVQLSHKKMMRRKGSNLFDKFMTIQEILTHGSRETAGCTNDGILSVTTV